MYISSCQEFGLYTWELPMEKFSNFGTPIGKVEFERM